ncbi:MAG: RNA-binding protein [Patescibacteria group bacterium]
MGKKLYVGNLSYTTNEASLKEAFGSVGSVESAMVIMDKMTGRSKGFGFVEMASDEEAANAVAAIDGKEIDGRAVRVSEARPMEERPRRSFDRNDGGSNGGWRN